MAEYDDGAYYTVHRYDLVVCSRSAPWHGRKHRH